MAEKFTNYDPTEFLKNPEDITAFMDDAFETNNPAYIAKALGLVARAVDSETIRWLPS